MEHLTRILDAILEEGRQQAEEIRREARLEEERILEEGRRQAERQQGEILQKAEAEIEEIGRRGASRARMERRNILLEAKRTALSQVFRLALQKLERLSEEDKLRLYKKLLERWNRGGEVVVTLSRREPKGLAERLVAEGNRSCGIQVSLAEEGGGFAGGLLIREGRRETDCTFESLLASIRQDAETQAAARLFPAGG